MEEIKLQIEYNVVIVNIANVQVDTTNILIDRHLTVTENVKEDSKFSQTNKIAHFLQQIGKILKICLFWVKLGKPRYLEIVSGNFVSSVLCP